LWLHTTARLRVCALLLAAHCALASAALAQAATAEPSHSPALVRYGKWAALGLAAGLTGLGATTHNRADRDYTALLDYCRGSGPCPIGPDGRYSDPTAEGLYVRVRDADRLARSWLVSGQFALVASAVLFVVDLKRGKEPKNIPYSGYVAAGRYGALVGVQVPLRRRR
jgi:hypothetical protein